MARIGKPRGLIDYIALTDEVAEREGKPPRAVWKHVFRPRVILYTALWSLVGLGLLFALFIRPEIEMTVAQVRNPQFVTLSDGSIRNAYDVRLLNKHGEARTFRLSLTGDPALRVQLEGSPYEAVEVPANQQLLQRVYVMAPRGSDPAVADRTEFRFWVEDLTNGERVFKDTIFNGNAQ